MKLLQSPTSPYARKVRMVILEKGLTGQVALEQASPMGPEAETIRKANPLGKVPCLIMEDGAALYDSPVICAYLDSLTPSPKLIPDAGPARWTVLRLEALADGIMDASVAIRMEVLRPETERSPQMVAHWRAGITRGLAQLAQEPHLQTPGVDLAHIAAAAAQGYLQFRLSDLFDTALPPALKSWWARIEQLPSVKDTAPPG